jgi:hypothetical protein
VVLIRALLCISLVAGCKQSLFDNHGGDDTMGDGGGSGSDDGMVPSSCPATCLADAAADFPGTKWRYLDDNKNRSWTPMTMISGGYNGTGSNRFSSCTNDPSAKACESLPGALLATTSDSSATAEPALSYTVTSNQVVQLSVRVHVPISGGDQMVRVYRNSREDSLFTAMVLPGATFERAITVDALSGDRFYLALGAVTASTQLIGVHFYINMTTDTFPKDCQLALSFSAASGTTITNGCGSPYTYYDYNQTPPQNPQLGAGPFTEQGMAADIPMDRYYKGADVLAKMGDTTTQLWIRHDAFVPSYAAFALSDVDLNAGGGLAIGLYEDTDGNPRIEINSCTDPNMVTFVFANAPYPADHGWHFVRVVHSNGMAKLCLDGMRIASFAAPPGMLKSTFTPYIGKSVIWTPSGAFWDGGVDDVRMFTGALPCE